MSTLPDFLPWQSQAATNWLNHQERFAHAWLIHGLPGIGKRQFAVAGAASLLCETPRQGLACGQCASCVWLTAGNHPDLRLIRPDAIAVAEGAETVEGSASAEGTSKKALSRDIRVEQLRSLHDWFNTATHRGGWRVAVLYPAQALNQVSANALLKLLEEPPEHTVFLLVADAPDLLLPTLVSRCRRLPLAVPASSDSLQWLKEQGLNEAMNWLAAAGGAPLKALELSRQQENAAPDWLEQLLVVLLEQSDPGPVANVLEKQEPRNWLDTLQRLFVDLSLSAMQLPVRYFPGQQAQIASLGRQVSAVRLSETSRWLSEQRAVADHPLNARLLVHTCLQRVVGACRA